MSLITNPKQTSLYELVELACASRHEIQRLYLHWTAGRYEQCYDDYHINIGRTGQLYLTCDELTELKAHTWHRNTGAVGIALCGGFQATAHLQELAPPLIHFGPYAPTQEQIESMAKVIAVISHALRLTVSPETVMTHEEAASLDGYGPSSGDPETRWDLWYLPDWPASTELAPGGEVLRGKALWYQKQIYNIPDLQSSRGRL